MNHTRLLTSFALLALTGAGCLAKPAPEPVAEVSPTPPVIDQTYDACRLLARSDAQAVLGLPVMDPLSSGATTEDRGTIVSSCSYATGGEDVAAIKVASLLVRKAPSADEALRIYEEAQGRSPLVSGAEPTEIEGLGDRAYWIGGTLTQLNVLKGDAWFIVNVRDEQTGDLQAQSVEAARRVLSKLE